MSSKDISLTELLNEVFRNKMIDVHTSIPAIVVSFDAVKKTKYAIPAIKRKYEGSVEAEQLPLLVDIPVNFPQSSKAIVAFPLEAGDPVTLVFSERSLDFWKKSGGIVDPDDRRTHSLSDAVAFPGSFHIGGGIPANSDDFIIKYYNGLIKMTKDDKITIGNNNAELLKILSDLLTGLENALVNTNLGPQPLINASTFTALKTVLDNNLRG